jgi:hypothetical protein
MVNSPASPVDTWLNLRLNGFALPTKPLPTFRAQ